MAPVAGRWGATGATLDERWALTSSAVKKKKKGAEGALCGGRERERERERDFCPL